MNSKKVKRVKNTSKEFQYIDTFYNDKKKYQLYLSPMSTEKCLNWNEGIEYAEKLDANLPTIGELQYLLNNCGSFLHMIYWSSTENHFNCAKVLEFDSGITYSIYKGNTNYVRVVKRVYL